MPVDIYLLFLRNESPPILALASFPKREAVYVDAVFIVAQAVRTEFYLVALGVVNGDLLLPPLLPSFC